VLRECLLCAPALRGIADPEHDGKAIGWIVIIGDQPQPCARSKCA